MSFPKNIEQEALVGCGRHCCLCHKFCGQKMELHHIIQGGGDTFDNCLPLCFDCHAEVKAYNDKHPKGKKYTEDELKVHRNNWYQKVKNSDGLIVGQEEYRGLDKNLFNKITKEILPINHIREHLKDHDFGQPYRKYYGTYLGKFVESLCQRPDFEFIDTDLEGAKLNLKEKISEFLSESNYCTFTIHHTDDEEYDLQGIPKDWRDNKDTAEQYFKYRERLNKLSSTAWEAYDEFIKLGRRKLLIPFEE